MFSSAKGCAYIAPLLVLADVFVTGVASTGEELRPAPLPQRVETHDRWEALSLLQVKSEVKSALHPGRGWDRARPETEDDELAEARALAAVPKRMQYWSRWDSSEVPVQRSRTGEAYLLFEPDIGGLNNIRVALESVGVLANLTGRTLVLPPPTPFYLIDYGPPYFTSPRPAGTSASKVEDFINLPQLRRHTRTLTFKQFLREMRAADSAALPTWTDDVPADNSQEAIDWRQRWKDFSMASFKSVNRTVCDINHYDTDDPVLYLRLGKEEGAKRFNSDGRMFICTSVDNVFPTDDPSALNLRRVPLAAKSTWQISPNAVALLRGGFVWHPEVFELAAPIVADLGMFRYASLHARYGDLQYDDMKESPDSIVDLWFASERGRRLTQSATVVYVATDGDKGVIDAFRKRGITARWAEDYFEKADSPIAALLQGMDPYRIHQLKGPVEQVICAFAGIFVGTGKSTFTNYINELRFSLDAPLTHSLFHTSSLSLPAIAVAERIVAAWEARKGEEAVAPAPSMEEAVQRLWEEKQEMEDPLLTVPLDDNADSDVVAVHGEPNDQDDANQEHDESTNSN